VELEFPFLYSEKLTTISSSTPDERFPQSRVLLIWWSSSLCSVPQPLATSYIIVIVLTMAMMGVSPLTAVSGLWISLSVEGGDKQE
jgi:hypothetical protein